MRDFIFGGSYFYGLFCALDYQLDGTLLKALPFEVSPWITDAMAIVSLVYMVFRVLNYAANKIIDIKERIKKPKNK